jgi:putative transposase
MGYYRVQVMRGVLAHTGKSGCHMVLTLIATSFAKDTLQSSKNPMAHGRRPNPARVVKTPPIMNEVEVDVLAHMKCPKEPGTRLHSTNPSERLNGKIKRCIDVVGSLPNDDAIIRLVGALFLEQNNEAVVQRSRHLSLETKASPSDYPNIMLSAVLIA